MFSIYSLLADHAYMNVNYVNLFHAHLTNVLISYFCIIFYNSTRSISKIHHPNSQLYYYTRGQI